MLSEASFSCLSFLAGALLSLILDSGLSLLIIANSWPVSKTFTPSWLLIRRKWAPLTIQSSIDYSSLGYWGWILEKTFAWHLWIIHLVYLDDFFNLCIFQFSESLLISVAEAWHRCLNLLVLSTVHQLFHLKWAILSQYLHMCLPSYLGKVLSGDSICLVWGSILILRRIKVIKMYWQCL